MITPKPIPKYTNEQRNTLALYALSNSTGMKIDVSQLSRMTPSWAKSYMYEATPGRPSNDSAKITPVKDPTEPNLSSLRRSNGWKARQSARNVEEIHSGHLVDSILAQSTDKYTDLSTKQGYELICKNDAPRRYVEARWAYIGLCQRNPMARLIKETMRDYISGGNAYWAKSRVEGSRIIGGRNLIPAQSLALDNKELKGVIGGYFRVDPRTIFPRYNEKTGKLLGWEQKIDGKDPITFSIEEIIHFAYKPPAGEILGIAMCQPVLEDIRALRETEEMCVKLIYKHLFPLVVYKVHDSVGDGHGTQEDIDFAVQNMNYMAPDGMLVVPPDTEVKAVDVHPIDAGPYLKYFLQRVLMGLGVSEAIMGIGQASSGQSDMLTVQMHDRAKSFQQDLEEVINLFVMMELLVEAGFDPIRRSADRVYLCFNEIEIETELKVDNHNVGLYTNGAITEDELRHKLRRNPLDEETRKGLYIYTYKIPLIDEEAKIKLNQAKQLSTHQTNNNMRADAHAASLEPVKTSVTNKSTAANKSSKSTTMTTSVKSGAASKGLSPAGTASTPDGSGPSNDLKAKNRPSNSYGTRLGPRIGRGKASER